MEGKVLAINLDKYTEDTTKNLNSLFEYAFIEGVSNVVIFSNGILDKSKDVKEELRRLASLIPSVINTTVFLGYKDGFRLSSKDIEEVTRSCLGFVLGNHTSSSAFGRDINFFNGEYNVGELDKVLGNISIFTSNTSSRIDDKSLRYGNQIMHVGPFKSNYGCTATEISFGPSEVGSLVMNYGIVSSDGTGFKKDDLYKVELEKDFVRDIKNGNKCLIKM